MLHIPPPPFRKRRGRPKRTPPQPAAPVGALTLVACAYDSGSWVQLTFDRPIDIAGVDGAAVTVADGGAAILYVGTSAVILIDPATVEIALTGFDSWLDPGVTLTATAANGIVAVGDGAAWAGVTDVSIPFP
jgi:hypothetical protein